MLATSEVINESVSSHKALTLSVVDLKRNKISEFSVSDT